MTAGGESLIVILGVRGRSGTNYLRNLLIAHPDIAGTQGPGEDYLLPHADLLKQYAVKVQEIKQRDNLVSWDWSSTMRAFGAGLTQMVRGSLTAPRVLTKTPSTIGIEHVEALFPECALLVIVRDGRDLVESSIRTYGYDFGDACRFYRDSVDRISQFRETGFPHVLVRYEALVNHTERSLRAILDYLDLDPALYDFVAPVPVVGSCEWVKDFGFVSRAKPKGFRSIGRWHNWTRDQRRAFADVCGSQMAALGYDMNEAQWRVAR